MPILDKDKNRAYFKKYRLKQKEVQKLKDLGFSNEEIKETYRTIKKKSWRMTHLYKIRNKEGHIVTFKPNRAQQDFAAHCGKRNLILKARQLGFTTYECIDILDEVLFEENYEALMIFHTKAAAEDSFFGKITLAWENIPPAIQERFTIDKERAGEMRFKHNIGVYSGIRCRTSGMSGTYSRLHVSEFGPLYDHEPAKARELLAATFPAVPTTGRIDIESTARGTEGPFYEMYMEAYNRNSKAADTSEWTPFFYNWTYDDMEIDAILEKDILHEFNEELTKYQKDHKLSDRQMTYYYRKIKDKGIRFDLAWKIVKQEYPTTVQEAFEGSDDKLFDADTVNIHRKEHATEPQKTKYWKYFLDYKPEHSYGIGVDVSEGIGEDASAITIFDFTDKDNVELVATYTNNKIPPDKLAYEIRNVAREYGNPLVAVERNNHGHATIAILKTIYRNIYTQERTDKRTNESTQLLGWLTTLKSKTKMFYDLSTAIDLDKIIIHDNDLLDEMISYSKGKLLKNKANPNETNHWDLLTSSAIAYQMKEHARPSKRRKKNNANKNFNKFGIC